MIPSSPRFQKHYCRRCDAEFVTEGSTSAHMLSFIHTQQAHASEASPDVIMSLDCGRYCLSKSQPEEIKGGGRIYGPGELLRPKLIKSLEEIQPEDGHL